MQALLSDASQIQVGVEGEIGPLSRTEAVLLSVAWYRPVILFVILRDAASRRELLSVIAQLADTQPDILVASLLHCLLNSGLVSKTGEPR